MLRVFLVLGLAVLSSAAPKSRNNGPLLVLDQKQKGDYNIQVHLKNFQVIALLGEDSAGVFGDYDYNYDYGDFPLKPSGSSTSSESSSHISITSTIKPEEVTQSAIENAEKSTTASAIVIDDKVTSSNSEKPVGLLGETKSDHENLPLENVSDNLKTSTVKSDLSITAQKPLASAVTAGDQQHPKLASADEILGQIQVQVLQSPEDYANFEGKKSTDPSGRANEKRCSSGFMKDKKGRCKRLRRPQSSIPFNFARLADLAARFRSATADGSPSGVEKLSSTGTDEH